MDILDFVAIVVPVVLFLLLFLLIVGLIVSKPTFNDPEDAEEKGPMPKRHGGFGPVHGGKS